MMSRFWKVFALFLCIFSARVLHGETTALTLTEVQSLYDTIRNITLDSANTIEATGFAIRKDVATFEFKFGRIYFFKPVAERAVAAYFEGTGTMHLSTENRIEKQQIRRFTGQDKLDQAFEQALFFFTDSTFEQLCRLQNPDRLIIPDTILEAAHTFRQRIRERFFWNVDARILTDIVEPERGHFFSAYLECPDDNELLYLIDPLDEEAVTLLKHEKMKFSTRADHETWYSSDPVLPFSVEKQAFDVESLQMDVEIETNEKLLVSAVMHFRCVSGKAQIVPLHLEHILRAETAILGERDTCLVIQEDKGKDSQVWIVFPYRIENGKEYDFTLVYSGEGLINDIGGDNFIIGGRTAWFPSFYTNDLDPRYFRLTFAVPEKMTMLATGMLVRSWTEDGKAFSEWESGIEHLVAGFNYGKFSAVTQQSPSCEITCYTNEKASDALQTVSRILEQNHDLQAELMLMPQELTTDGIGKNAAIESRNAYEVFNHFFGDIPIRNITISQQPQVSFGASWPTLIFLPFTAFYDESVRRRLFEPVIGLRRYGEWEFFHEGVASHEIAHQWWGHSVMTASYHDEWLNEGFASYSEGLHIQVTKGVDDFKKYMQTLRRHVFSDVGGGKSLDELGPIWLGERLSTLDVPQGKYLIYAKGAYILHMLRMLLFDYDKKSDERFIKMMKDYVRTYMGRIATTEDFKRVVEKHFGRDMDWFFDQWVYGTEIPVYSFNYSIEESGGDYFLTINARQSDVSPQFEMPVPFVVNFREGHAVVHLTLKGNETVAKQFHLPQEPVSIEANPWSAVLCTIAR